ncbi:MAG TPA: hypothetical protein VF447_08400 [Terriglobales bacterium]
MATLVAALTADFPVMGITLASDADHCYLSRLLTRLQSGGMYKDCFRFAFGKKWRYQISGGVIPVTPNRHTILDLLKAELKFLDTGGYRRCSRSPWRAAYVFEESPSCPNYSDPSRPHRCTDCWLTAFVPADLQSEQIPCRFVQLTPDGVSVDSLYRYGTPVETEQVLRRWLHERIRELESELSDTARLPFAANE